MRLYSPLLLVLLASAAKAAPCEAQDPTTAEVNAREGVRLAKKKQFVEAVPLFRIAVRLDGCSPEYPLLLARGLARTDAHDEARDQYQQVIDRFPGSPEALLAQKEVAEMEVELLEQKKKQVGGEAPPPASDSWDLIGYGTMGAGVLSLVLGMVYALDAQDADDALQTASRQPNRARYDDLVDQRSSSSTLAWTFYGVGGALVAGGAVMAFVLHERPAPAEGKAGLALVPAPGGFGLSFSTGF
ncbi:MAG: hypothetical protein R3F60_11625 [bacterium]